MIVSLIFFDIIFFFNHTTIIIKAKDYFDVTIIKGVDVEVKFWGCCVV